MRAPIAGNSKAIHFESPLNFVLLLKNVEDNKLCTLAFVHTSSSAATEGLFVLPPPSPFCSDKIAAGRNIELGIQRWHRLCICPYYLLQSLRHTMPAWLHGSLGGWKNAPHEEYNCSSLGITIYILYRLWCRSDSKFPWGFSSGIAPCLMVLLSFL